MSVNPQAAFCNKKKADKRAKCLRKVKRKTTAVLHSVLQYSCGLLVKWLKSKSSSWCCLTVYLQMFTTNLLKPKMYSIVTVYCIVLDFDISIFCSCISFN